MSGRHHHILQQQLVYGHFHYNPTNGHREPLGNIHCIHVINCTKTNSYSTQVSGNSWNAKNSLLMIEGASGREGFEIRQFFKFSITETRTSTTLSVNLFKNSENSGWKGSDIETPGKAKSSPTSWTAFSRISNTSFYIYKN